jgi:RNA polymerase sigma-70 factor (ECF subfamily)
VLVAAVLSGAREAVQIFESAYLAPLRASLSPRWSNDELDDALQALRERLLVGPKPQLRTWPGRDPLTRWLRLCALREVMTQTRSKPSLPSAPAVSSGLTDLPQLHRAALERALEVAVKSLEPWQRGILKLHLLENVSVDSIAILHGVSRATMTRWLSAARTELAQLLRAEGKAQLDVGDSTLDSLARPLLAQLEVSLAGLLKEPP